MSAPRLLDVTDLARLAAQRTAVLKAEDGVQVELLGPTGEAVVRKVYRNRGLRLLQSFARPSRAAREFRNLQVAAVGGLPCTPPLGFSEDRRSGCVLASTLLTLQVPDTRPLKAVLAGLPRTEMALRRRLLAEMGRLLARLHGIGLLWCASMPRNFLLEGPAAGARLWICDLPTAVRYPRRVPCAAALVDLYDAAGSPSRRRDFSRSERLHLLRAYAGGDRAAARRLWRRLARRRRPAQQLHKAMVRTWRGHLRSWLPWGEAAP